MPQRAVVVRGPGHSDVLAQHIGAVYFEHMPDRLQARIAYSQAVFYTRLLSLELKVGRAYTYGRFLSNRTSLDVGSATVLR